MKNVEIVRKRIPSMPWIVRSSSEHLCIRTEDHLDIQQIDVDYIILSDSLSSYDTCRTAAESSSVYLLGWTKLLLSLRKVEGRLLGD